ncbi:unnamed protein product [Medioppia subpectinata]|uniref:Glycosyltransferase n=1 Tax=Medioppia subpectinata TaxID=1979941 RepID=A0A7R9PZR6_9ACAR|nr:unnamed protein product [Medioppia subpectinata]CAG2107256.1 unnamed protein product [Medioppia subpectinata]
MVLFSPINLVGPINASIGIGEVLRDFGHRVVFAVRSDWRGKLNVHGFEEEIIGSSDGTASDGSAKQKVEEIKDIFGSQTRLDKMIDICKILLKDEVQEVKDNEPFLQEIVERVKPDVILTDHILVIPSLMCSSIPWVLIMSCNPLSFQCGIDEPKLPPQGLGLPTNGDPKEWSRIRQLLDKSMSDGWTEYNSWLVSKGIPSLPQYKTIQRD